MKLHRDERYTQYEIATVILSKHCHLYFLHQHNPKIQQIQDIWAAGLGVVSLHIFQSVIPVEAYTREACMIDALGKFTRVYCQERIKGYCINEGSEPSLHKAS